MAIEPAEARVKDAHQTVFVDTFTDGLLGPEVAMLGPVADGGHVVWNSTPGCWGPMITPAIRGGHEVAQPVAVAGAEVGDAIAIRIKDIEVTSLATASGTDQPIEGRFNGDPFCAPVCPGLRDRVDADPGRGDRPGGDSLHQLRRRRHPVHVRQRVHDRLRRAAHGRPDRARGDGRGVRARGPALRRPAR